MRALSVHSGGKPQACPRGRNAAGLCALCPPLERPPREASSPPGVGDSAARTCLLDIAGHAREGAVLLGEAAGQGRQTAGAAEGFKNNTSELFPSAAPRGRSSGICGWAGGMERTQASTCSQPGMRLPAQRPPHPLTRMSPVMMPPVFRPASTSMRVCMEGGQTLRTCTMHTERFLPPHPPTHPHTTPHPPCPPPHTHAHSQAEMQGQKANTGHDC